MVGRGREGGGGVTVREAASRAAGWVVESLTLSGGGRVALWTSLGRQHRPPLLPVSGQDRTDLRSMGSNDRFGVADLEFATGRTDDESGPVDH
jgi:hypothetical protein